MNQTFYGVDIILLPEDRRGHELHTQGKVIEINGLRSGASFYKARDMGFYLRIMQEFAQNANGRVLLHHDPEWEFKKAESPDMKRARDESHSEQLARTKQWQEYLATNPPTNFFSVHDYLVEKVNWEKEHAGQFKTSQTALYLRAAREAGLDVDSFVHVKTFGGLLKYVRKEIDPAFMLQFGPIQEDEPIAELPYGTVPPTHYEQAYSPLENIGLVWTSFGKGDEMLLGRERVLNGFFAESILADKALFYLYSQFLPEEARDLQKFIPSSYLYGLGMHTQDGFREWLQSCKGDMFVKKPLFEAHGIGVEFLTRDQMGKYNRSPFHNDVSSVIREGYRKLVMDLVLGDLNLGQETVIFQDGVESTKILDEESGNRYTACARAIVQNGRYVGAIWRSNKKDDSEADLTERLRHNVTHGAGVMPVSESDSRVLGEIAEASVSAFESTNRQVIEKVGDMEVPYFDLYKGRPDVDHQLMALQNAFYLGRIKRAAQHYGVDISRVLDGWVEEVGLGARLESSEFVDKIKSFNEKL